jgi:nucleotide-binding universal stress UspA family protein
LKILLAVDGSDYTIRAANFLIAHFDWFKDAPELHLLHVKLAIPTGLAFARARALLGQEVIDSYYKEEAERALAPAEELLRLGDIPFQSTYKIGSIAEEICLYASTNLMDMIVMGSHGHGAFANLVMGSVATKVLATAMTMPVLIVR